MDGKYHAIIGFVTSVFLVLFFNFSLQAGIVIFLSSILIDIDHYFWYAFSLKDKNPIRALKWYYKSIPKWKALSLKERNEFKRGVFIFHGMGFWIILFLLSFIHVIFLWILIGIGIHMILDFIDLIRKGEPLYGKICVLYVLKRNKNKRHIREL